MLESLLANFYERLIPFAESHQTRLEDALARCLYRSYLVQIMCDKFLDVIVSRASFLESLHSFLKVSIHILIGVGSRHEDGGHEVLGHCVLGDDPVDDEKP